LSDPPSRCVVFNRTNGFLITRAHLEDLLDPCTGLYSKLSLYSKVPSFVTEVPFTAPVHSIRSPLSRTI
jgi:hypothetical protein